MCIFTIAKRRPVSSISVVAEAGVVWSVQGLACCELVTRITNVREAAWVYQTGEPCCVYRHKSVKVYHESKGSNHFVMPLLLLLACVVPVQIAFWSLALWLTWCNHTRSTEIIHLTTVHTSLEYILCRNTNNFLWMTNFTDLKSSWTAAPSSPIIENM